MAKKATIGAVVVHKGMPPEGNPYLGHGTGRPMTEPVTAVSGPERIAALQAFREGKPTEAYTFWEPGGQGRLTSPDQVDWETSGIGKTDDKPAEKPADKSGEPVSGASKGPAPQSQPVGVAKQPAGAPIPAADEAAKAEDKAAPAKPEMPADPAPAAGAVEKAQPIETAQLAFAAKSLEELGSLEQLARIQLDRGNGQHAVFFVTAKVVDGLPQLKLHAKVGPEGRNERTAQLNGEWLGAAKAEHAPA